MDATSQFIIDMTSVRFPAAAKRCQLGGINVLNIFLISWLRTKN